jgi:hypothetical protein
MSQRGSIHRRGDSWTVRWRTETADGRKQHSKGGFRTKKEAQEFLTDTMAAIRGGVFSEPTKVTLGEFLTQRWLPARKLSLRPSTWSSYEVAINRHVLPQLGGVQMQQLSPDRLDRFYADLSAAGLAPKTVRNIHVMIHKALHDAVRKNLVPRNAAEAADPPKLTRSSRSDMSTWTPEQLRDFFAGIAHHRLAAAYLLAATTGMRRGEVLGLRWADVDFTARHLHVRQTILSVSYELTYGSPRHSGVNARSRSTPKPSELCAPIASPSSERWMCSEPGTGTRTSCSHARTAPRSPRLLLADLRPDREAARSPEDPVARPPPHPRHARPQGRRADQGHVGSARPRNDSFHDGHLHPRHPRHRARSRRADRADRVQRNQRPRTIG